MELKVFAAQTHKVDYTTQSEEEQKKIQEELEQTKQLSKIIMDEVEEDVNYYIARNSLAINAWTQKFMMKEPVSEEEIKEAFEKEKPKALERVNLRNLLIKDDKKAQEVLAKLQAGKDTLVETFTQLVRSESEDPTTRIKDGRLGWLDTVKLDQNFQQQLAGKKKHDVIMFKPNDFGWQIILIEDKEEERTASYEESKDYLEGLVRQNKLQAKIEELLG
jgi:parvulin-like peptidyl-prolyl isomerase